MSSSSFITSAGPPPSRLEPLSWSPGDSKAGNDLENVDCDDDCSAPGTDAIVHGFGARFKQGCTILDVLAGS